MLPSLLTDADTPKPSPAAVSSPKILTPVGGVAGSHPPEGLVNTYAAPASVPCALSAIAPTTIVLSSALAAVDLPKSSLVAGLDRETPFETIGGP